VDQGELVGSEACEVDQHARHQLMSAESMQVDARERIEARPTGSTMVLPACHAAGIADSSVVHVVAVTSGRWGGEAPATDALSATRPRRSRDAGSTSLRPQSAAGVGNTA